MSIKYKWVITLALVALVFILTVALGWNFYGSGEQVPASRDDVITTP